MVFTCLINLILARDCITPAKKKKSSDCVILVLGHILFTSITFLSLNYK